MNERDQEQLRQIKELQEKFKSEMQNDPYPLYPNYGNITQFKEIPINVPEQRQLSQPGVEKLMVPLPIIENPNYQGSGKLKGKVALITGGDSGIGAAAAMHLQRKALMSPLPI